MSASSDIIALVDMDGVLTDFTFAAQVIYNKRVEVTSEEMAPLFNTNKRDFIVNVNSKGPEFWSNMPETVFARDLTNLIECRGLQIIVCTNPGKFLHSKQGKQLWLNRFFSYKTSSPYFSPNYMFQDVIYTKYKELCRQPNTILIDDFESNCEKFGHQHVLVPQPWNRLGAMNKADTLSHVEARLDEIIKSIQCVN